MSTTVTAAPEPRPSPSCVRPRRHAVAAFGALLLRDLHVLRKNLPCSSCRTVMQPLLLVFVFTYVFPKIGQGVGGARRPRRVLDACSSPA